MHEQNYISTGLFALAFILWFAPPGGGGVLLHKIDGGALRKISKNYLKGTTSTPVIIIGEYPLRGYAVLMSTSQGGNS